MNQQVNLLAPIFRKRQTVLSGRLAVLLCAVIVAVLGVLQVISVWQVSSLEREQTRLEVRRTSATQQLNQLAEQIKAGGKSQELVAERDLLASELAHKRNALAALSRSELGNTTGFSPQFMGLARQRLSGLWLTRIDLASGGRRLELQGITLSEDLLPRYLALLGTEQIFKGIRFGHAQLSRPDDSEREIQFELRSQEPSLPAVIAPVVAPAPAAGASR